MLPLDRPPPALGRRASRGLRLAECRREQGETPGVGKHEHYTVGIWQRQARGWDLDSRGWAHSIWQEPFEKGAHIYNRCTQSENRSFVSKTAKFVLSEANMQTQAHKVVQELSQFWWKYLHYIII